jgi:hypothetical protein
MERALLPIERIPYDEFDALTKLCDAHLRLLDNKLLAVVAFGDTLRSTQTHDIEVLEVVKDWDGPNSASFDSTAQLPLRGRLNIFFISPEEFEAPLSIEDKADRLSVLTLMEDVLEGYVVIHEHRTRYVEQCLSKSVRPYRTENDKKPLGPNPLEIIH